MPELATTATLGHVDVDLDRDGIARSVYLHAGLGTPYWANLGLALLERFDAQAALAYQTKARETSAAQTSPYAWTRAQPILIPFAGPPGHFSRLSFVDVLKKDLPDDVFRDKYVFVGATAAGLGDILPTPVNSAFQSMPGGRI